MRNATEAHPSAERLAAFAHGRLDPEAQADIERHVAACDSCCARLRGVPEDTLVGRLRAASTSPGMSETPAPAPSPLRLPPGLADHPKYRIVRPLGGGGMGIVYQAEHRVMERPVALKVVRADLLSNPAAVERFRQEVKAAARLSHPNIVTAHDADQAGDTHFLVMELVDGISLARVIEKKGPLPIAHACAYIRQAALGLQHAHEKGMIHRDIKPHNLMLTRQGTVKILDFGLARFATERAAEEPGALDPTVGGRSLTQFGMVLGTPDFIAPEQARDSRRADIRADIYSLGCTLYYLLTGRAPFEGATALEKLVHHFETAPPALTEQRAEVPQELALVVGKMLAKDPVARYQTPAEVALALAPFSKPGKLAPAPEPTAAYVPEAPLLKPAVPAEAEAATVNLRRGRGTPPAPMQGDTPAAVDTLAEPLPRRPKRKRPRARSRWPLALAVAPLAVVAGGLALFALPAAFGPRPRPGDGDSARAGLTRGERGGPDALSRDGRPGISKPIDDRLPGATVGGAKPVLMVLPQFGYWPEDYWPVREELERRGLSVKVATPGREPAGPAMMKGPPVQGDLTLPEVCADCYSAVVFVGGAGVKELFRDKGPGRAVGKIIQEMDAQGKPVTGLCAGILVLADHGALRGRKATRPYGKLPGDVESVLDNSGARLTWSHVERSDNIVTGMGGVDQKSREFANALADVLLNRK